jgi:hypothetical protein
LGSERAAGFDERAVPARAGVVDEYLLAGLPIRLGRTVHDGDCPTIGKVTAQFFCSALNELLIAQLHIIRPSCHDLLI